MKAKQPLLQIQGRRNIVEQDHYINSNRNQFSSQSLQTLHKSPSITSSQQNYGGVGAQVTLGELNLTPDSNTPLNHHGSHVSILNHEESNSSILQHEESKAQILPPKIRQSNQGGITV